MKKKALIFWGGWDGHTPELVSKRFARILENEGFEVRVENNMDCLDDFDYLLSLDLIIPCWTGGMIKWHHTRNIARAVGKG